MLNESKDKLVSMDELRKFKEEIAVHQRLYHPNVVLMMGACTTGEWEDSCMCVCVCVCVCVFVWSKVADARV